MRVGLVQLCSGTDIPDNIAQASDLIRQAAEDGATLVATPEMTHLMQRDKGKLMAALFSQDNDPAVTSFGGLAKELGIDLLIGSLAIKLGDNVRNRSFLFGRKGLMSATYDKIHLFDVTVSETERYRESATYHAGEAPVVTEAAGIKLGLSICYDLRFPNLYRYYAQAGAHIISVPAAFTVPTGQAHWEVLLRARAIETGSFVIAPAQGGQHADGRQTYGHSMIVNPWGEVLAELAHDRPGYICADLDLSQVDKARNRIPAWSDRRTWQV